MVKSKQIILKNDILVCASSGSKEHVGKAALFNREERCSFGAFCKLLRPLNQEYSYIISEYFKSDLYRDYIENLARGSNINNLKNEHFDNIEIPVFDKNKFEIYKQFIDERNDLEKKIVEIKNIMSLYYKNELENLLTRKE